ncbi:MAG: T9SS type A sorting domain-containing protein, partial [Phaeodactylibacter sp.]|nr:T9SS type A sorting domain-containing protein [Phaeodactylibacter sp.]
LDFDIEPGTNLALTTNTEHNQSQFGFNSARLRRSDQGVSYPYVVEDVVEITTSNLGNDRYYYFFNWKIQKPGLECASERVEVPLVIVGGAEAIAGAGRLAVMPNPVSDRLEVRLPELQQPSAALKVYDATGQLARNYGVRRGDSNIQVDTEGLPAGLYLIRLVDGGRQYGAKVVKR